MCKIQKLCENVRSTAQILGSGVFSLKFKFYTASGVPMWKSKIIGVPASNWDGEFFSPFFAVDPKWTARDRQVFVGGLPLTITQTALASHFPIRPFQEMIQASAGWVAKHHIPGLFVNRCSVPTREGWSQPVPEHIAHLLLIRTKKKDIHLFSSSIKKEVS